MHWLFEYPDPDTESVDFASYLKGKNLSDPPSEEAVKSLTLKRAHVQSALRSTPSSQILLSAIEDYILELKPFIKFVEVNNLTDKQAFKWRASLNARVRKSFAGNFERPTYKCHSIYFEVTYVNLAYAFALANMARRRATAGCLEEDLKAASSQLCMAAGIFQTMANVYSVAWAKRNDSPPETDVRMLQALAELSLADAQQLACALAELKDISPGNRIKLKAASAAKYRVAAEIITTLPKEMYDDLGDEFTQNVRFVAGILEGHLLFQAAKNEAEKEQYGRAVALITSCHNMLLLCAKSEDLTIRDFATKLLPETDHLCTQYTKTNNYVTYQPVPESDTIRKEIRGQAKLIVDLKPAPFS